MRVASQTEVLVEAIALIRHAHPNRGLPEIADQTDIEESNLRAYLRGIPFPPGRLPALLKQIPSVPDRERLKRDFNSAKAAHEARVLVLGSGAVTVARSGHEILLRAIRREHPTIAREARVFEIMERSVQYQRRHAGVMLALRWKNSPELIATMIDASRQDDGEGAAFSNAATLFQAMRWQPIKDNADSLSALTLAYRVGDLAAQFDDWEALEEICAYLRQLSSDVQGRESRIFCHRMLDEYASLQTSRFGARKCLKFARKAADRFSGMPKRPGYLAQDFSRLQSGWASTFFNLVQAGLSTARTERRVRALREMFDSGLAKLGVPGSMTDDAASLKAADPYRAQIIGAQELWIVRHSRGPDRHRHIDNALGITTFAIERFAHQFSQGETILAQLRVDHAAALLATYRGERKWPIAEKYAAARRAAVAACSAATVSHKMGRLLEREREVQFPGVEFVG